MEGSEVGLIAKTFLGTVGSRGNWETDSHGSPENSEVKREKLNLWRRQE